MVQDRWHVLRHDAIRCCTQADSSSHSGATPLVIVAIVLFIAAIVVRKVIKLAIVVVIAGIVALLFAGWRGGLFG